MREGLGGIEGAVGRRRQREEGLQKEVDCNGCLKSASTASSCPLSSHSQPGTSLFALIMCLPSRAHLVHGFSEIDKQHLALLPKQYTHGFSFGNITCEGRWVKGTHVTHGFSFGNITCEGR